MVVTTGIRAWCHINEFREEGYAALPAMIAFSDPLVLWGPSATLMDSYYPRKCALSSKDLLDLVEKKEVRIAGRREWLTDRTYREHHPWKAARWKDQFDEQIRTWALEDKYKPAQFQRVMIVRPETGMTFANKLVRKKDPPSIKLMREIRERITQRRFHKALLEKVGERPRTIDKVQLAIRDLRNHGMARIETKSDVTISPWNESGWLFGSRIMTKLHVREESEALHRQLDAVVKLMGRIGAFPKAKYLHEFLGRNYRKELVNWLADVCAKDSSLRLGDPVRHLELLLQKSIEEGLIKGKRFVDWTMPKPWRLRGVTALGMVVSAVDAFLNPSSSVGMTIGLAEVGHSILERVSLVPLSSQKYKGPQWPFIATTGHTAHWRDVTKLMSH